MPKVAVTDYTFDVLDIEKQILEPLGCNVVSQKAATDKSQLIELVHDADCVITQFAPVTAEVISSMTKCELIVRYGIGVDNVDIEAAAERRIPVCNVPDYCTDEVADHTLAMITDLTRRITQNTLKVRSGQWTIGVPLSDMRTLRDMTVGIVGYGRIGREVARRLQAFKCRILVTDPVVSDREIASDGLEATTLETVIRESDLLTLHCPSTEETRGMMNRDTFASMKSGALLVNVSRGTLVITKDLVDALESGALSGAAVDVVEHEPIDSESPLLSMGNVLINAHVASASLRSGELLRTGVAGTVADYLNGKTLRNVVNGVSV